MSTTSPDAEYDVIVIGSGAAGLTAALAAAGGGASVVVLEAATRWGGTTAVSGGLVWAPNNHLMDAQGLGDTRENARVYCRAGGYTRDEHLIDAFVDASPRAVRMIEDHTPITFHTLDYPDTFSEAEGGFVTGRHLECDPIATDYLGPWQDLVWTKDEPTTTMTEILAVGAHMYGFTVDEEAVIRRRAAGEVTGGTALVTGLLRGIDAAGVARFNDWRVEELLRVDGRVVGVRFGETSIRATRGVVLAAGGFEWDAALNERLLTLPMTHPVSPPSARGDSLRLAAAVGAQLARTSETWSWPGVDARGDTWDDQPRHHLAFSERYMPHSVWVNRAGRRFVNESSHNCAIAFGEVDLNGHRPRNLPCWAIVDSRFRASYPFAGVFPGDPVGEWVRTADTLEELAGFIDVDADALLATVSRFNEHARVGLDPDFHRGETAYERAMGDPGAAHPNLAPLEEGPFYAVEVVSSGVGTKGGARVDEQARVLDYDDRPIDGLFAAGNAMAAVFGPGIFAGGMTLGNAVAWGYLAGIGAASAERG